MRRALAVGVVSAALVAAVLLALHHAAAWHWVEVHTGTVNESGPYYGFWSGFGSDIGEAAMIGGLITIVRHHNCHHRGCWRLSAHTTAKGHKLCKHHVGKPNADLSLHPIHGDHLG